MTYLENNTKTTQTTEVSEELTIENCAGVKGKLDIKSGKSEQETSTQGKNLCVLGQATYTNIGVNVSIDNSRYTLNGTTTAGGNFFKVRDDISYSGLILIGTFSAGTYTYSSKIVSGSFKTISGGTFATYLRNSNNTLILAHANSFDYTKSFTLLEETTLYLQIFSNIENIGGTFKNTIIQVQIEEGETSTDYEASTPNMPSPDYPSRIRNVGEDGSADFKITGKNKLKITSFVNRTTDGVTFTAKFDKKGNLEYINAVGNSTTGYRDIMRVDISNLPEGKYKINGLGTDKVIRYVLLKGNNAEPKIITTNTDVEFTQDSASPYLHFRIDLYMAGEVNATIKPMIRPSIITDNTYEPYQEQIKSFPFTEGQVLHKGDYLASDGIHQKKKTLVLTGNETWNLGKNANSLTYFFTNAGFVSAKNQNILCNSLTPITNLWNEAENKDLICIRSKLDLLNIMLSDTTINTVESFKAWLVSKYNNGTPVTIEYELAEEIVIPYTEEQEEARYEMQHLLMYEGYTQITCIDEIKPDIQGTYYFNNELNNSYGERFDKVEDSINELEEEINNNNTKITTIESDINSLEANKLTSKGTNSTQGSWQSVPLDDNDHFVILVISGTNYTDWKILPKSLIKKYTPSSTLKIIHNGTTIVQIAWNANSMVEYIWTTGYTITHYTY